MKRPRVKGRMYVKFSEVKVVMAAESRRSTRGISTKRKAMRTATLSFFKPRDAFQERASHRNWVRLVSASRRFLRVYRADKALDDAIAAQEAARLAALDTAYNTARRHQQESARESALVSATRLRSVAAIGA